MEEKPIMDTADCNALTNPGLNNINHISNALHVTLDPHVSNHVRQQALQHLEAVKSQPNAPEAGFTLAEDRNQSDTLRYYGLQLLEYAVRFRWHQYSPAQTAQLRTWVTGLAVGLRDRDAPFVRNKIGQLWVEVAKRCWGGVGKEQEDYEDELEVRNSDGGGESWWEMDAQLLALWERSVEGNENGFAGKLLVLYILETLSEEIINGEDAVAGLRTEVLGHALNEVMIPAGLYGEAKATRGSRREVRAGNDGWLSRMCGFFAVCVKQARLGGPSGMVEKVSECAVKALNAIRPTMGWISLKAVDEVDCIDCLYLPLHTSDRLLQTAAVEVLYALLSRPFNAHWQTTWMNLFRQALSPELIGLIRQAFEQTQAGPGEDDEKHTLQKKMSELVSVLADAVSQHSELTNDPSLDLPALFDLMLHILQAKSLTVSIPVLHSWTKQMGVPTEKIVDLVLNALGTLLQTCSERLLRYEALPEDTDDEVVQFLMEDFDTVPERHAFLGNYRRYCNQIINSIARSRPIEALSHVLGQMLALLQEGPYTVSRDFNSAAYSRTTIPVLRFDAQNTVVSSALKGYSSWINDTTELPIEDPLHAKVQQDQQKAYELLQQWCYSIVDVQIDDPCVADQVIQTLVSVLRTIKSPPGSFVLRIVQHLLTMKLRDDPAHTVFSDAVRAFEVARIIELQKIALAFPNNLLEVYHELEPRILELAQEHSDEPRLDWGYKAFLFMIIHRASGIEQHVRLSRLQSMLKPTYEAWTSPSLNACVSNLQAFCETVGLGNIHEFYRFHGFDHVQDWAAQQLDASGQARQHQVREMSDRLPLRMTKSLLAATTERLKSGTDAYETACRLWGDLLPAILPNLLQMLRHAQAFHNMSNWSQMPEDLQAVVRRTLQDRFWQSGISSESKDEFYARISGSKTSYEGFASTVRGTMRNVREQGYHILYLLTKFDEQFYGLIELADPLADALFSDATSLNANHLQPIINLTTGIVQRCPPHRRAQFLPPIIRRLFITLDAKIGQEWDALDQVADRNKREDDELSDEMRTESVLRQLAFTMVSFVPFLLEHDKQATNGNASSSTNGNGHHPVRPTLSDLVLSDPSILEPLILFCTHTLRKHDTRCCTMICRVFRQIIPMFASTPGAAAATTSTTRAPPSPSSLSKPLSPSSPSPSSSSQATIITPQTASQVREFVSTDVLQACITSLHEPYFADTQKDLAALIAQIIFLYAPLTSTPRQVLLSLPDMSPSRVDKAISRICRVSSERQQRSLVLDLLENLRGVSIYEAGKIERGGGGGGGKEKGVGGAAAAGGGGGGKKGSSGKVAAQYMEVETKPMIVNGDEEGLDGVAGLFGDA